MDITQLNNSLGLILVISLTISLAGLIFGIIIWWKIFSKAGYSGAMGLLIFVPIANLIVICILAFGEWPIHRELNQLRQMAASRNPQYPPNPQYPQNPQYRG